MRLALLLPVGLLACTAPGRPSGPPPVAVEIVRAPGDRCLARDVSPALVEIETVQELVREEIRAPDGTLLEPAIFRSLDRPRTTETREAILFEAVCPEDQTPELIASLQRALEARAVYAGPITGRFDAASRAALLRYQRRFGQDSDQLSLETARRLGLVAIARQPDQ